MSWFEHISTVSLRKRMIVAIIITGLCMSAVVYIWYASFKTSLSGSFEITSTSGSAQSAAVSVPTHDESFFSSLQSLVGDIDFNVERFSEIKESFTNIFSQ